MHCQPAVRQPLRDGPHHVLRLLQTAAVNHRVVCVACEWTAWAGALHPSVECVVHEQVHQDGTDHAALRRAAVAWNAHAALRFERRNQPPFGVQNNPVFLDVGAYRLHQQPVIYLIEGRLDIKFRHPVISPAAFTRARHGLLR